MQREVYLDNSATTKPYNEVNSLMFEINESCFGNPSSMHTKGLEAERLISNARSTIMRSLNSDGQLIFTSGGTESNNLSILGYLEANPRSGRHIITTKIEHPSVLEVFKHLESKGYKTDFIGVDKTGAIDLDMLKSVICSETALVSIQHVNSETGVIQPIDEVIRIKNSLNPKTVIHIDAVQSFGKLILNTSKLKIDLLSVSSHKIHGPKGVGAVLAAKGIKLKPLLFGGGQEASIRSGTENVAGICGFGKAAEITALDLLKTTEYVASLKSMLIDGLKSSGLEHLVISPENSSPYILNISFACIKAEVLLHHLEREHIFISTGSACSSRKKTRSIVLMSMGLENKIIDGAIRFSFSKFNDTEDIKLTLNSLKKIIPGILIRNTRR